MSVERTITLKNDKLVEILNKLKAVEGEANEYFESIKDLFVKFNTKGFKPSYDELRKKSEIQFKDENFKIDRQILVDELKDIVSVELEGKLEEYEELATVDINPEVEGEAIVKIVNVLEEFKKAYAEKNAPVASPYSGEFVA